MAVKEITPLLTSNPYPGRGIILGKTPDGRRSVSIYFIMGRSENSRNRIFTPIDGGIKTQAFDINKLSDPSLVIYSPVRTILGRTIVTNGDQTDTIYDHLATGKSFEDALNTRTFEPDGPNFTPRISGLIESDGSYKLSILKTAQGNPSSCQRFFFNYETPVAGEGHFIHTYQCDGNPLPSFQGEPVCIAVTDDLNTFAHTVWDCLNSDNKVSLYAHSRDIITNKSETVIINKHQN